MRRSTVVLAIGLGIAAADAAACNAISGVGDYTFGTASSSTGSGGSPSTTPSTGGTAGGGGTAGSGGGVVVVDVPCPTYDKACAVEGQQFCCYDNLTVHAEESGRCIKSQDKCLVEPSQGMNVNEETVITCTGPQDCVDGDLCCATYGGPVVDGGGWYSEVACKQKCEKPDSFVVTGPNCDCPTNPDAGDAGCKASVLLPDGYFVCP